MTGGETGHTLISCDEAGFTGPQLLNEQQPYFVYASHDIPPERARTLLAALKDEFNIQGDEIKSSNLRRRRYWPDCAARICDSTQGRAKVVYMDKKVAFAGKVFEYFFEPVLEKKSSLFYSFNFHRFIMNVIADSMEAGVDDIGRLAAEAQAFMRSFQPEAAPGLFAGGRADSVAMDRILRFCRGYADTIARKTAHLRAENSAYGKWTLDLTSTALFSLLFHGWGHRHPRLKVLCDDSKPLADVAGFFDIWVGRDKAVPVTDGRREVEIRGDLIEPISLGPSSDHPTLQLADLLAGVTMDVCMNGDDAPARSREWVRRHAMHDMTIEADPEHMRKGNPDVRLSREVLKELAARADAGADPLEDIERVIGRNRKAA